MRQKKGTLHCVIIGFMIVILLIVSFCIMKIWAVENKIREKNAFEMHQDLCKQKSDVIRDASDFLTDRCRSYVYAEDETYLTEYCTEAEEGRQIELAMKALMEEGLTRQETTLLRFSQEKSEQLMDLELYAMRLTAEAQHMKESDMPKLLQTVKLAEETGDMSDEVKLETARRMVLSEDYRDIKNELNQHIRAFQNMIQDRRNTKVDSATIEVQRALYQVQAYSILLVLLVSVEVVVFYLFVILPFLRYSRELSEIGPETRQVLKPAGLREMKKFANMFNDIYTNLLTEQKKLERMSTTDSLTGIANRTALDEYLNTLLSEGNCDIGLLMIDIDNFKMFNDGFGHLTGDQVLIRMGQRFEQEAAKQGGLAARLGGEEFVVVLPSATVDRVEQLAAVILDTAMNIKSEELGIQTEGIKTTVSVGSTIWPNGRKGDLKTIIRQADIALYQAKGRGKNQHMMFSEEEELFKRLEKEAEHQMEVESDLFRALEKEEFIPFFQPKYRLDTGKICGAEALVRWEHWEKGFLYPDYFVPILEKDGFITKIDFLMFEQICMGIKEWEQRGLPLVPIACNFSRLNFGKKTIVRELIAITDKYGVSPSLIQVELTENSLLEKDTIIKMEKELEELREAGFSIAIDDFGTGYSSLGMLHELTIDVLKVDKSFLHRDLRLKENELLLSGILYIAETMHLEAVVEGVETQEQADLLRKLGFKVVQGFYFSKPVRKSEFEKLLREQDGKKE